MNPVKFTITGSKGILAGLGRDTLTMNLDEIIPADAVTVAIKGNNGVGKSTIFNLAMNPFRSPPMIGDQYAHFGDTGLRELEFTHAGQLYRSRIEIHKTAKTKSTKATLHHKGPTGWEPYLMPDNTVSDGKNSTYDACLEHVLGPASLFFLSAFRSQGAQKLGEYTNAKELMQDLLSLYNTEDLRDKSKEVRKGLTREFDRLKADHDRLGSKATQLGEAELQVLLFEEQTPALITEKVEAEASTVTARKDHAAVTESEHENKKVLDARNKMQQRIDEAVTAKAYAVQSATTHLNQASRRGAADEREAHAQQAAIQGRMGAAQSLLERREEVDKAIVEEREITDGIPERQKLVDDLQKLVDGHVKLKSDINMTEMRMDANRTTEEALITSCESLKSRAGFITEVPCGAVAPYDKCPALLNAISAEQEIPGALENILKTHNKWDVMNEEIAVLQARIPAATEDATKLGTAKAALAVTRQRLTTLQPITALKSGLEQADKALADATAELMAAQTLADERSTASKLEVATLTQAVEEVSLAHENTVAALRAEKDAMPLPDTDSRLNVAKSTLLLCEQALRTADQALEQNGADIVSTRNTITTLKAELAVGHDLLVKSTAIGAEIAQWQLLALALQGVIDLTIEDAGPSIASTANSLLTNAYGPRFSLQIVTQRRQANGKLVECFDIVVIDSESGLESSILSKSGGEAVFLDRALTDAVALYYQDLSGTSYEAKFADETDGALDAEKRAAFFRMDKAALELGGYERKFFISHASSAWDSADFTIDLNGWAA